MKTLTVLKNPVFVVSTGGNNGASLFQSKYVFSICLGFKFSAKYIDLVESAPLDFGLSGNSV